MASAEDLVSKVPLGLKNRLRNDATALSRIKEAKSAPLQKMYVSYHDPIKYTTCSFTYILHIEDPLQFV